jgi:MSHA pilin protein MshC
MHVPRSTRQRTHGFTLVELILVMVVIGILSAVGAARFFDRASYDAASYTEQMRSLIRFGQKMAIAQNRPVFVRLNGASVALCFGGTTCDAASQVRPAAGNNSGSTTTATVCATARWACEANPAGVSYASPVSAFYFDPLGRPCAATDAFTAINCTFQKLSINVTGDGSTRTVVVEPETGYVH